jgi:hypothetical protein
MFERLKQSVVESYVGAIALGWLLAQSPVYFANIFTAPVARSILRREYRGFTEHTTLLPASRSKMQCPSSLGANWLLLLQPENVVFTATRLCHPLTAAKAGRPARL